jgi:hypothetical protein
VGLARARALEALGDDRAGKALAEAEARLSAMGARASGWDGVFRKAARASEEPSAATGVG